MTHKQIHNYNWSSQVLQYNFQKLLQLVHFVKSGVYIIVIESLTKIPNIHKHHTRNVDKIEYFLPRVNKFIGQGQIAFKGIKFWAEIELTLKKSQWNEFKTGSRKQLSGNYMNVER